MKISKKEKIFCASPAPLLWKGLFYFVPLLTIIFIVLASQLAIRMYVNKKKHKKIFDKANKILSLWTVVVFLSLITYGLIGLDFNYYLLEFFLLTVFVLGAFYFGERFRLFMISRSRWIFVATLSLLFAVFFVICYLGTINAQTAFAQGMQASCINRLLF